MIQGSFLLLAFGLLVRSADAGSISRQLQMQQKWWAIGEPDFDYQDSQFSFKWTVSDYIADAAVDYTVYDGHKCKEGSTDVTEAMNNYNDIRTGAFFTKLGYSTGFRNTVRPHESEQGRWIPRYALVSGRSADSCQHRPPLL